MSRRSALLALVLTCSPAILAAQASPAAALKWGPAPPVFPAGAQMAVVSGDPSQPGPFIVQLSFPDGYKIMPHNHPTSESIEVLKGTFLVGMGDKFDADKTNVMAAGKVGTIKAGMNHYAMAKGATVVQVTSTGPFAMTYVNPADDPTKNMKGGQ